VSKFERSVLVLLAAIAVLLVAILCHMPGRFQGVSERMMLDTYSGQVHPLGHPRY
jgi:hypothetical protein